MKALNSNLKPLVDFNVGERAAIASVSSDPRTVRRLLGLGLRLGSEVEVLQLRTGGMVLACASNRVAIGDSLAAKLMMSPI